MPFPEEHLAAAEVTLQELHVSLGSRVLVLEDSELACRWDLLLNLDAREVEVGPVLDLYACADWNFFSDCAVVNLVAGHCSYVGTERVGIRLGPFPEAIGACALLAEHLAIAGTQVGLKVGTAVIIFTVVVVAEAYKVFIRNFGQLVQFPLGKRQSTGFMGFLLESSFRTGQGATEIKQVTIVNASLPNEPC